MTFVGAQDESLAGRRYPADAVQTGHADIGRLAQISDMDQ